MWIWLSREYIKAFLNREFGCNQIASSLSLFAFLCIPKLSSQPTQASRPYLLVGKDKRGWG
jgi:hypothetical protein